MSSPAVSLSPVDVLNLLRIFIGQLENLMEQIVENVSVGRGTFEFFRPSLTNYIEHCSESISRLEEDLRALQDLERVDLEAQTELTFADVQAEAARRREVVQKSLAEKEVRIASLQGQRDQIQAELIDSAIAMRTTQEAIAQLQVELAQKEAQLAQEEANVKGLHFRSAEILTNYCKEVQTLEEIKKEAAAAVLSEGELRRRTAATVRATHEKQLSDVKSRLASINLMGPQT
ncbi:uncharacterized protein LOC109831728 [Asparagus officinalis]|uniref:uncharacterized protein LOC109831728 n=1 Tax=Asparagus officinalis TaxID=4686 RepID=UPI00098E21C7|nr:uncharacterized protein LOC109831728 [Asparagus officinalis]